MISNILFDLDGTLIDSSRDIINCLSQAYKIVFPYRKYSSKKVIIGPPLQDMVNIITPGIEKKDAEKVVQEFRTLYDNSSLPKTKLCPGVMKLFQGLSLKSFHLFLVTNKPQRPTKKILQKFSLNFFEDIMTPDIFPGNKLRKEELVQTILQKHHLDKSQTCLVGDSESDVNAAHENGIISVALLNGYGKKADIMKSNPDFCIKRIDLLVGIIQ